MAGTGFNYIREIMQMNLPEEEKAKKFHYIGLTPYEPFDNNCMVRLMPAGMAGVIAVHKSELRPYNAEVNDVVEFCGRLLVFTERKHWVQFVPGPCTNYDGPNPYEKKVMVSTAPSIDSPLAEMIREKTNILMDRLGIGYDAPSSIEQHGNMVIANYDIKYIGETVTDIANKPKKRSIIIRHMNPYATDHYARIGNVVTYKGLNYIFTGEDKGWELFTDGFQLNNKEENNMAFDISYLGESELRIYEGSTNSTVKINGKHGTAKYGDIVMSDGELYAFAKAGDGSRIAWRRIKTITLGDGGPVFCYNKVKPNWLTIKKVHFNNPLTVVLWQDGTKTIVRCSDNEAFDPEKGLAMAITKKVFGNKYAYHDQIKKLLPEPEEDDGLTIKERLNKIFGDPRIADAKKKLAAVQELICDMALRGATKAELMRAIRFSKDLIDFSKGADIDITESVAKNGIVELEAKYQPKK